MGTDMKTPWQKVYDKFGLSQAELARALDRHRSKISRAIADPKGLISSPDQVALLKLAKERGVDLDLRDLVPDWS